jgi:hypothetical protein
VSRQLLTKKFDIVLGHPSKVIQIFSIAFLGTGRLIIQTKTRCHGKENNMVRVDFLTLQEKRKRRQMVSDF